MAFIFVSISVLGINVKTPGRRPGGVFFWPLPVPWAALWLATETAKTRAAAATALHGVLLSITISFGISVLKCFRRNDAANAAAQPESRRGTSARARSLRGVRAEGHHLPDSALEVARHPSGRRRGSPCHRPAPPSRA